MEKEIYYEIAAYCQISKLRPLRAYVDRVTSLA